MQVIVQDIAPNIKIFFMYFTSLPDAFKHYYLKNNLNFNGRKIKDIQIMSNDGSSNSVGFPTVINYNGVNYINLSIATQNSCYGVFKNYQGVTLHDSMPFSQMTGTNKKNYKIGGNIDFDNSYIYWSDPLASTYSVIPFKIEFE